MNGARPKYGAQQTINEALPKCGSMTNYEWGSTQVWVTTTEIRVLTFIVYIFLPTEVDEVDLVTINIL